MSARELSIQEIKEEKNLLTQKVNLLLQEFYTRTGLEVSRIEIIKVPGFGNNKEINSGTYLIVQIP